MSLHPVQRSEVPGVYNAEYGEGEQEVTIRNNGHYEQVVNFRDRDSSFIRRIRLREWSDGLELSVDVMGASRSMPDTLVVPPSPSPAIPDLNRNQRGESHTIL